MKGLRGIAHAAVLMLAMPSAAEDRAAFPIGMYGVAEPHEVRLLAEEGFNSFQTYTADADVLQSLAHAAKRSKMVMIAPPEQLVGSTVATQSWPVGAWYVFDEPDVHALAPSELELKCAEAASIRPRRPTTFVIGRGGAARAFAKACDVMMIDWYPVPHMPLTSLSREIDAARRDLPAGKPLWAVVQAFDWKDYPEQISKGARTRFPDRREIRFMAYSAVMHGASGIFFFTLQRGAGRLYEAPELWGAVTSTARELRALEKVFAYGRRVILPFPPDPDGPEAAAWRHGWRTYVVIANPKQGAFLRVPPELLTRRWRPLFEPRRKATDLLKGINGSWYLSPSQVLVLEGRLQFFQ